MKCFMCLMGSIRSNTIRISVSCLPCRTFLMGSSFWSVDFSFHSPCLMSITRRSGFCSVNVLNSGFLVVSMTRRTSF